MTLSFWLAVFVAGACGAAIQSFRAGRLAPSSLALFLTAAVLGVSFPLLGVSSFPEALLVGFFTWLGFMFPLQIKTALRAGDLLESLAIVLLTAAMLRLFA